jgi:hypothetical protein
LNILEENLEKTFEYIGTGKDFLNRAPVAQEIRARTDKWDLSK